MPAAHRRYCHIWVRAWLAAVPLGESATSSQLAFGGLTTAVQSFSDSRSVSRLFSVDPTLVAENQALMDPADPTRLLDICTWVKLPPVAAPAPRYSTMLDPEAYSFPDTPPWSHRRCSVVLSNWPNSAPPSADHVAPSSVDCHANCPVPPSVVVATSSPSVGLNR